MCEPVGVLEISLALGVKQQTVAMWKYRRLLPVPRWQVSGQPAWDWYADIEPWAAATGRLHAKEAPPADDAPQYES